jgi:hypothetical protein
MPTDTAACSICAPCICSISRPTGRAAVALTDFVNRSDSDEVVFFAADRLGRGDEAHRDALAAFILKVFDLDLMLAADLIARSPDTVWLQIADEVGARLTKLSKKFTLRALTFDQQLAILRELIDLGNLATLDRLAEPGTAGRLVGLLIEHRAKHKAMVATRMTTIIRAMRSHRINH